MPKRIICPFWKWCDDSCHCEGGKITFPDRQARADFERDYCASQSGWKKCSISKMLNDYYNRK